MYFTVYRMEHKSKPMKQMSNNTIVTSIGHGCYVGKVFRYHNSISNDHSDDPRHPSIRLDVPHWYGRVNYYESCVCACETLESLNDWFKGWKGKLLANNFIVVKYTVKRFTKTISGHQVMFHPKNVISKETIQTKKGYIN